MSHPVRDSSSLPVGGAPVERGWRDLLSNAFDVFNHSREHKKKHRAAAAAAAAGAGASAASINSAPPEHEQQRAAQKRPAALLRASSRRLHHAERAAAEAEAAAAALSPGEPGGARRSSWLLDSARHEDAEWTAEEGEGGDGGQQDENEEDAFPSGSPSSSASGAAGSPLEPFSSPPPPAASPSEVEALQNEMAARTASALQIASVAAAYTRGDCIPVIRDTAAHGRQRSSTMAPGLESPSSSSQTGLHDGPCVESLAFGETQCADCNSDPQTGCAWAQVLARSNTIPVAQLRTELRALCWQPLPAAHRAAVWLVHTVGTDPAVLAHWETYYAGLLASAAATVATSPIAGRRVLGGSPTGSSYSSPHSSPSSPSGRSRAKFTAIAFGELLKDVERTLPNFAFFADKLGLGVLQRLLTAFSLHRPLIGYCQSLNALGAMIALTFQSHSEAHAFAVLACMLECRLAYYTKSMLGCVLDSRVLRDLVSFFEPELTSVLSKQDVSVEHFSSSWMLCLFIHAPLSLPSALRIWDLYVSLGESILFHTGLALFHLHARSFTSLHKPSAEMLMNIVLKIIGTTTSIEQLVARVRETIETIPSMTDSIEALRKFHKHAIVKEASVLNVSKLRRLERSTGLSSAEIQRLWDCFLQGADKWSTLVSGVCNDLVHFRAAFGAAVFPPHANDADKAHSRRMSSGAPHGVAKEHESPKLWKGSGIVQATLAGVNAAPCILCVPPLPKSFHLDSDARPLHTCPRCTWLSDGAASQPLIAAALAQRLDSHGAASSTSSSSSRRRCTCRCTCVSRVSGLSSSVFGRLFRLFDSRGGVYRGFLDFDSFLFGTSLFTQSNRAQRLRAVFTMAAGEADPAAHTAAGNVLVLDDAEAVAEEAHVVRGRVTRAGFIALVQDFETLYHGYALMPAPEQPPSAVQETTAPPPVSLPAAWRSASGTTQATSTTAPASGAAPAASPSPSSSSRPVVLSSLASSQMFVDMAFEKAAADRARASVTKDTAAAASPPSSSPTAAARLAAATQTAAPSASSTDDSLSYESFAACIVLHPLIANFFRLDAIAD